MMRPSRAAFLVLFAGAFLLEASLCFAANPPDPKVSAKGEILFISTDPMGAVVVLDGRALPKTTPMLLRDLSPGKHRLSITRMGYRTETQSFTAEAGKVAAITMNLHEDFISPVLPADESLEFKGRLYPYASHYYEIPTGSYTISRDGNTVSFAPIFPGQNALSFFNVLTPIVIGVSAVTTIGTIFSTSSHPDWSGPVASYLASAISIGIDISLHVQKARYINTYSVTPVPRELSTVPQRYRKASELLSQGDLSDAADQYIAIIEQPQDSIYYPLSLYQLGRIQLIQGDVMLATAELRLIVNKYPLPEIYDKACKSLADIADRQADYKAALGYLGEMVFYDPLYPKDQIEQYRSAIEERMSGSAK